MFIIPILQYPKKNTCEIMQLVLLVVNTYHKNLKGPEEVCRAKAVMFPIPPLTTWTMMPNCSPAASTAAGQAPFWKSLRIPCRSSWVRWWYPPCRTSSGGGKQSFTRLSAGQSLAISLVTHRLKDLADSSIVAPIGRRTNYC